MKCIKSVVTNQIKRVSDEQAAEKVATGKWVFCSKAEWKKEVRNAE